MCIWGPCFLTLHPVFFNPPCVFFDPLFFFDLFIFCGTFWVCSFRGPESGVFLEKHDSPSSPSLELHPCTGAELQKLSVTATGQAYFESNATAKNTRHIPGSSNPRCPMFGVFCLDFNPQNYPFLKVNRPYIQYLQTVQIHNIHSRYLWVQ